jgi:hypothetical protein
MSIGITGCHRGGNLCFSLLLLLHCGNKMQLSAIYVPANKVGMEKSGGEGGIRTPGRGFGPYNGLANRRIQPLCHLSAANFLQHCNL